MDQSAKPDWAPERPEGQPEDLEPPIKEARLYQHNRLIRAIPNPRVSERPEGQPEDLEPPIKEARFYPHNRFINTTPHPKKLGEAPGAGPAGGQGGPQPR